MGRAKLVNALACSCGLAMLVTSWTPSAAAAFATPRGDVPFVSYLVRVQNDRLKYADMESYDDWEVEDDEEYDQFLENKKLADQGDTEAQYKVGNAFFKSIVVETNADLGIEYLTTAAENGHVGAQSYLGGVFYSSFYGRQDYDQAHYWTEKAVKAGDLIATHQLGSAYLQGNGVTQDVPKAVTLFERASRAGWNPSRIQLAKMMMSGEHIEKNVDQSVELLKVAADANSQQAHYELAILRTQGIGMPMDISLAIEHFEKASSYLDSKYRLALLHIFRTSGQATEKSAALVSEVLTRESKAQYIYGLLHEFGLIYIRNIETSLRYYGFAARNGHKSAEERMRLLKNPGEAQILPDEIEPLIFSVTPPEITYIAGATIENNPEKKDYKERAVKLFRMAADQGHAYAEMKLGSCYRRGFGVEKDENQALYWLERAAAKGVQEADLMLKNHELMDIKVLGPVPPFLSLLLAARAGNLEAVKKVALAYYRGDGVDPDFGEALVWFMKGAEEGHALSSYNVGVMNENGEGVPKNTTKALEWYRKADSQGYDKAISAVERLEGKLAKATQLKADAFVDVLKNDVPGAVRKFKQLAEFGDDVGIYTMGTFYENGYGVTKNLGEAKRYYEAAAKYGNQDAIDALQKLGSE